VTVKRAMQLINKRILFIFGLCCFLARSYAMDSGFSMGCNPGCDCEVSTTPSNFVAMLSGPEFTMGKTPHGCEQFFVITFVHGRTTVVPISAFNRG
jgi:hypothetical protein